MTDNQITISSLLSGGFILYKGVDVVDNFLIGAGVFLLVLGILCARKIFLN